MPKTFNVQEQSAKAKVAAQLEQAKANHQKFVYIVSHDLQAPIRAINSYSQFLLEDFGELLAEDGREYIEGILENAKYMDALIGGLLDYSRLDQPKDKPVAIDMNSLLKQLANPHNLDEVAQIQLLSDIPIVWGYEAQIKQAFLHVIDNALKFSQDRTQPKVNINFIEDQNTVTFSIADNGIGIEEKFFEAIFNIFRRLHTLNEYPGIGIGLAIVKKIVKGHGGQVWLESKVGVGTTVYISLPKDGLQP